MSRKHPEAVVDQVAAMLAAGSRLRAACKKAGIGERTGKTWAADPAFQSRVRRLREQIISRTLGIYATASVRGALESVKLLNEKDPDVRQRAINAINAALLSLSTRDSLYAEAEALEAVPDESD